MKTQKADQLVAVFCVKSMVTPAFIDPELVQYNEEHQIYKLREGAQIPEGLVKEDMLDN